MSDNAIFFTCVLVVVGVVALLPLAALIDSRRSKHKRKQILDDLKSADPKTRLATVHKMKPSTRLSEKEAGALFEAGMTIEDMHKERAAQINFLVDVLGPISRNDPDNDVRQEAARILSTFAAAEIPLYKTAAWGGQGTQDLDMARLRLRDEAPASRCVPSDLSPANTTKHGHGIKVEFTAHSVCQPPNGKSLKAGMAAMDVLLREALPILREVTEDTIKQHLEFCRMKDLFMRSCLPEGEAKSQVLGILQTIERRADFLWFDVSVRPKYDFAEIVAVRDKATRRSRIFVWKCPNGFTYGTSEYLDDTWSCPRCKGMSTIMCGGDKTVPWPY